VAADRLRAAPTGRAMSAGWDRIRLSRFGTHLFAAVATLAMVAPVGVYLLHASTEHKAEHITQAVLQAATHARLLEGLIERAVTAPRLLGAVSASPEESGRRQAASDLFRLGGAIDAFELVADDGGRLRFERGVELAGARLAGIPALRPADAPALTVQDGVLILTQTLETIDAAHRRWGQSRAYIGLAQLIAEARLADLPREGFGVRLQHSIDAQTPGRELHLGGAWTPENSATQLIEIPGSGHLRLDVSPVATRFAAIPAVSAAVLLLTAALCWALVLRLLRRPLELQREVARHTQLLRQEKDALEQEIARRTELDRQLAEHAAFLEQLLRAMPGPVFTKDARGRYVEVNPAFERFFGQPREALLGKTVFEVAPFELATTYQRADAELMAQGGTQCYESSVRRADGALRDVIFHKAVLHNADGATTGIVGIVLDITERKAAEQRLARLNRMLAALSETNRTISRVHDVDTLFERVGAVVRERGGFPFAWLYVATPQGPRIIAGTAAGEFARRVTEAMVRPGGACPPGTRRFGHIAECCGETLACELAERGLATLAHLPLWCEGLCVGGIELLAPAAEPFGAEQQQLLEELAANVSFALDALAQERRRRQAEDKLQLAARVFENSAEGILVTDAENRIVMVNKSFTQVTGYEPDEVIGCNPRILSSGTQGAEFYRGLWQALKTRGEWHGEIENRRKNGEFYPEWLTISAVRSEAGELTHHVAVFSDLTARKQIEERLNFLAHYDALTSLPNRILFTDRLQQALAKARSDGQRVAVAFLDLDRFQLINETIGPAVGDRLLQEISGRLAGALREGDSVSRMGGDEFALIFTGLAGTDEAAARITRIQHLLRAPVRVLEHELHCSASIGVAVFPDDAESVDTLVKNADSAMYKAMEDGGNTFRFFRQDLNQRTAERMKLEGKLHYALERGELMVYFQPLVSAISGRIVGAEALLRWQRADLGGFVSPVDFVPLLEETGLIGPVGEWVLRTACEENQRWRNLTGESLFVAVNLSAVQLADVDLAAKFERTLRELAFDPCFLEIELTESSVMRDADVGIRTLRQLKALGLRLSLDDFGTGYSSLSYLKRLPLDTLKVDRSFVHDTPQDTEATFLTRAIIAMGHSLRLEIVAEGVETAAQVALLRAMDCDILQGYHFSPAVPAEQFRELLRSASPYALPPADEDAVRAGCGEAGAPLAALGTAP